MRRKALWIGKELPQRSFFFRTGGSFPQQEKPVCALIFLG
jgi:hypothetical protein